MVRLALRIGLFVVLAAVIIGAAGGGLVYLFQQHFYFDPPKADYPKPSSALVAQRQDLDYFTKIMALDRSFRPDARAEAERRVEALDALPAALPLAKLHVALMQIMALADNGHTKMRVVIGDSMEPLLPVRVTRFAEGFYVMRAKTAYRDLLGGRVESIDGMPFDQVLKQLETLRGGKESFRRENAAYFVVDQDLLYGLGIARDPKRSEWTVRFPDGRTVTHILVAEQESDDIAPYGARWRSPEPLKGMGADWTAYRPRSGTLPESETDIDNLFTSRAVRGSCARYVRVEDIADTDGQKIQPFLSSTEGALKAHPPCAVILDLRGNGGGDYTNMWHFTHALPGLVAPGGRIVVLTDPMTFSAAITTTAFTKDAGGDKVTIVGEPVGDRLAFYAEGGSATLPNSKFSLSYETGKHDYAHLCTDLHDCFWLNWLYPVRVKTLEPDIAIAQRFSDWDTGHDLAFERAVALAGSRPASRPGS
jgi:hypothetical protein